MTSASSFHEGILLSSKWKHNLRRSRGLKRRVSGSGTLLLKAVSSV
jgi:hypothetical protein